MKKSSLILVLAISSVSLMATSQVRKGTGMVFDDAAYMAVPLIEKPLGFGANLPKSVSLEKYVPEVGDQGALGTCTGWSSTYYLATMEYAILSGITDRNQITAMAYDPLYTYVSSPSPTGGSDESCGDGRLTPKIAAFLIGNDVKRMNIDPASCGTIPDWDKNNAQLDFTDYQRLFDIYSDRIDDDAIVAVCNSLANNHPVLIGIKFPNAMYDVTSDGLLNTANDATWDGGHALCIVGYDDFKFGGCFTIVNSWDKTFGKDGYFYMTYADFLKYGKYGYSFDTELKYQNTSSKCLSGDCENGYGIMKVKKEGRFEGYFYDGDFGKGIYMNPSRKKGKGGIRYIKKLAKKHIGEIVYTDYGSIPIGFVKTY